MYKISLNYINVLNNLHLCLILLIIKSLKDFINNNYILFEPIYIVFKDNIYNLICINIILYMLSYSYPMFEYLLYILNNFFVLYVLFLIFININCASFKNKHPIITFFLSILIIGLFLLILYNTYIYIMDFYFIIKQYIILMNPISGGPNDKPFSSSGTNNSGNNPNKDPGSGSGAGFKSADEDKKDKKNIFDFSKLDDLLNKNKKLYEENKKPVINLESERLVEELKDNVNTIYSNHVNIIKEHVDHLNSVNDVFSSKNRSQAKSILHKIREDLDKYDNLKDEFFKSLNPNSNLQKTLSFLNEQNEHLLRNNKLTTDLERLALTAIEKDIQRKNLKDSELNMYTFIRSMQLEKIAEKQNINGVLTGNCVEIYLKLSKNQKT